MNAHFRTANMQRSFLLNLALLLVLNLLVKPFYILGIDAGVQDAVGSAGYGTYAALLSLSFLLNIVLDLGMTSHNTRNVAQYTHLMGKTLGNVLGVRVLLKPFDLDDLLQAVSEALINVAVAAS